MGLTSGRDAGIVPEFLADGFQAVLGVAGDCVLGVDNAFIISLTLIGVAELLAWPCKDCIGATPDLPVYGVFLVDDCRPLTGVET